MAVLVVVTDRSDGGLSTGFFRDEGGANAVPDFEDKARRGDNANLDPGNAPDTGARIATGGQKWNGGSQTSRYEGFLQFTGAGGFVLPVNQGQVETVAASLRVARNGLQYDGASMVPDSLILQIRDWTPPLSGSAWVDMMPVGPDSGNYAPEAEFYIWGIDTTNFGNLYETSGELFFQHVRDRLLSGDPIGYALMNYNSMRVFPGDGAWLSWVVAAGATDMLPKRYPALQVRTQRKHALNGIGGASIQMTDGTAVFLRYDSVTKRYNLYYQRINQTTPTLIDYLRGKAGGVDNSGGEATYYGQEPGFQSFSLTRDESNNLYVTGVRGNAQVGIFGQKIFNVNCFRYNGLFNWTRFTQAAAGDNTLSISQTHRGFPNNFAPVWLPGGVSANGQLAIVHSRRDGQWGRYQVGVSAIDAGWLVGIGATRSHNSAYAGDDALTGGFWRSMNASGSNLDAFRDGGTVRFTSCIAALPAEPTERSAALKCTVTNNLPTKPSIITNSIRNLPADPDGKARAVWMGDNSAFWAVASGGYIQIIRKADDSVYRWFDLPAGGIPGFPSSQMLQSSQAWDVVWDSGDADFLWVYYRNANNPRMINKARLGVSTGDIQAGIAFTPDPIGVSGSEIVAIRVPRQQVDSRCVLVDVAMQDGAGVPLALITIRDTSMNKAPLAPVVDSISSFNASSVKQVDWTFLDSNPSDFAIAQDIEIQNVTTGVTVVNPVHTTVTLVNSSTRKYRYTIGAGALTNDTRYQLRVRSYDSVDAPSVWSDWMQFSTTSTGGSVAITSPAADNLPLNRASVDISWSYTNTNPAITQTGYRVRVFNSDTGLSVSDSNLVVSTAKTYTVSGLTSDIEYRVEVTIRDSNGQTSGAGIRLITPDFNNPSLPEIDVEPGPGFIEIRVTNPPPSGDNPITIRNQIARKEAGQDDLAYVVVGECPPNGVYQDWAVASGTEYVYKARGSSE
jgi:hypothetical protein